jgi:hypothetical protein
VGCWHGRGASTVALALCCHQALLEDGDITKVGLNISGDAAKLAADWGVVVRGSEDLGDAAAGRVVGGVKDITANTEAKRWSLAGEAVREPGGAAAARGWWHTGWRAGVSILQQLVSVHAG